MKKQSNAPRLALLLTTAIFLSPVLSKASWAQVPSTAEPGIIMKGLQEEKRAPSRLEDTVVVPKEESADKNLSAEKVFVLSSVALDGSSAYKDSDLAPLYKDLLGQKVSFADLNVIAQRITRKYREDGYIFSRAVLPPQKVSNGVIHLRAVEGRIATVNVVGKYHDKTGLIETFANKIRSSGAANTKEIERYLLLIDDLPGITAKSFIKPSALPGSGDLVIDVQEDSFEGSIGLDNRGSEYIGPYKGTMVWAFNSPFGRHERTTFRGIAASPTSELLFGDITHEEQIGCEGLKIKGRAAFTGTEPGGNISALDIDGDSQLFDLEASYPLSRSRNFNINIIGGVSALNSKTHQPAGALFANDYIRSMRAGGHVDFTDSFKGVTQIDGMVIQGLDVLGATSDGAGRSRISGEHTFLKATLNATRIQEIYDLWSLMMSASGQTSRDDLLASEAFTVGGQSFGRAYDSGEISGDTGWSSVAELRYGGPVNNEYIKSYQVYTFIDYGRVHLKTPAVGELEDDSVTSAGVGTRFNLEKNLSGYLELDKPLTKQVASEGDDDYRLFFSVLKRF